MRVVYPNLRPLFSHGFRRWSNEARRFYATQLETRREPSPFPVRRAWKKSEEIDDDDMVAKKKKRATHHARLELKWLSDKVSVSKRVKALLDERKIGLAHQMTKIISQTPNSGVVCWNHLIEHELMKNPPHIDTAWKYFNDVSALTCA
jgi:hypothetical protein